MEFDMSAKLEISAALGHSAQAQLSAPGELGTFGGELKSQRHHLQNARDELELGCLLLDKTALIREANLTAAVLLEVALSRLANRYPHQPIFARPLREKKLETALREIDDLKAALDQHAIAAITDPQGKITGVIDKFSTISKWIREELLGKHLRLINAGFHSKEFIR
jgi:PAS domain-containing protein